MGSSASNQLEQADDGHTHVNPDKNIRNSKHLINSHWKLKIEPTGTVTNGLITLKISGLHFAFRRNIRHIVFGLKYKKIGDNTWMQECFYGRMTCSGPWRHINIRVATNLYDYNMMFLLTMLIPKPLSIPDEVDGDKVPKNKWFAHSNSVTVNIPSLMREPDKLKVNDIVKFRAAQLYSNKWLVGELIKIDDIDNEMMHTIEYFSGECEHISADDIKPRFVHNFIDLSGRQEADKILLIGQRNDIQNCNEIELYNTLFGIFKRNYVYQYMHKKYWNRVDFISAAKCVALNVMDYLSINTYKGYKIKCVFDNIHYDNTLKLMADREYAVGRSIDLCDPDTSQGTVYFCDVCRCRQGSFGWMYRCQKQKDSKYNGHDVCLTCVYDMVKRYDQLHVLLVDLLKGSLTNDCIQSIFIFIAGDVVKL